jgi:hypothetical protein
MSVPSVPEGGNTKTPSTGKVNAAIHWCFTLNNWSKDELDSICAKCANFCKFAIIGSEVGEQGTPHLQGYIEFKTRMRPMGVFDNKRIHFEKCKGKREDNVTYCSKEGNVVYTLGMPKPIKIITDLYDWQKDIEKLILTEPDDRTIYWYWEPKGNIGKSQFIKYCIVKHNILYCSGGKHSDLMNLVFNCDMEKTNCVMFDVPRANEGHVSYSALESIKNGMVCNTKYETGSKVFNSPHIIVFANFPPADKEKLSADRWRVINLRENELESDDEYDNS